MLDVVHVHLDYVVVLVNLTEKNPTEKVVALEEKHEEIAANYNIYLFYNGEYYNRENK